VRDAGGPKLYREQQQQQKDEVPVPEARRKKRLRDNERNQKMRDAGGPKLYREQLQKAKLLRQQQHLALWARRLAIWAYQSKLLRQQQQRDRAALYQAKLLRQQQQRDREARRAKANARRAKTRAVVRDEGEPAAQRLATQVVKLLLRPIMFARCLASLKRSKVWRVVLRYAKLLLQAPAQIFYVDIEGHKKIGAWEVAIVKQDTR
jgi:uncharacterized membrane protein YccC